MHRPWEPPIRPTDDVPLVAFFALAFGLAWVVWIAAALFAPDAQGLAIAGAWAPSIAAVIVTWRTGGRSAVRGLLGGVLRWHVGVSTWFFAILGPIALALLAFAAAAAFGVPVPSLADVAARFGLPARQPWLLIALSPLVFVATMFLGPVAEELGWRGLAQPALAARIGVARAGLAIGFVWSLWHLPLFVAFPAAVGGVPLAVYVPLVTALGVLFAWLHTRSGGSVLLCMLLHTSVNVALGIVGAGQASASFIAFTALIAVVAAAAWMSLRASPLPAPAGRRGDRLR